MHTKTLHLLMVFLVVGCVAGLLGGPAFAQVKLLRKPRRLRQPQKPQQRFHCDLYYPCAYANPNQAVEPPRCSQHGD